MFKKQLTVEDQSFEVTFPNAGQLIDIWNNQMIMSNGQYETMAANSRTKLGGFMLDVVDAISTFTVLVPGLAKQLNVEAKSFTELDHTKIKAVVKVYRAQFYPWYSTFLSELLTDEEAVDLNDDKDDASTSTEED